MRRGKCACVRKAQPLLVVRRRAILPTPSPRFAHGGKTAVYSPKRPARCIVALAYTTAAQTQLKSALERAHQRAGLRQGQGGGGSGEGTASSCPVRVVSPIGPVSSPSAADIAARATLIPSGTCHKPVEWARDDWFILFRLSLLSNAFLAPPYLFFGAVVWAMHPVERALLVHSLLATPTYAAPVAPRSLGADPAACPHPQERTCHH